MDNTKDETPGSLKRVVGRRNADYCRAYRARKIIAGKCIAGCGADGATGSGLCVGCRAKYNDRQKLRNRVLRKNTGRPTGRVPAEIKAWLAVNETACGWQVAVCDCGRWFRRMDKLAPYHMELNWCPRCSQKPPNDAS